MATKFGILIVLILMPASALAHSEILFPKVFSPAELATTGFALFSPEAFTTNVRLLLVSASGMPVTSILLQIPPGGQIARLGSELFPDVAEGGWVYAVNDGEGMQGFWLNYDAEVTFMDGAEGVQLDAIGPDQVIPLVAGQTEVNVINPNALTVQFSIRLYGNEGPLGPAFESQLQQVSGFRSQASVLFPTVDMTQARYIRIRSSGAPLSSTALIRGFLVPVESAVVNGVNVSSRAEMIFPHVVNGNLTGASYSTVIGVTNLSGVSQTVTITFNPESGPPVEVARTIPANGALRETAQNLFGLPPAFQSGWVRVRGSAIAGFAAYADSVGGGMAVVPAGNAQSSFSFSHIANGPPQWQTGLALLNAGAAPANVEVRALNPAGELIGGVSLTLDPGKKIANVIDQLIPATRGVNGGFILVRSTNNVPLHGVELFYTQDLRVLCNVAPGRTP